MSQQNRDLVLNYLNVLASCVQKNIDTAKTNQEVQDILAIIKYSNDMEWSFLKHGTLLVSLIKDIDKKPNWRIILSKLCSSMRFLFPLSSDEEKLLCSNMKGTFNWIEKDSFHRLDFATNVKVASDTTVDVHIASSADNFTINLSQNETLRILYCLSFIDTSRLRGRDLTEQEETKSDSAT